MIDVGAVEIDEYGSWTYGHDDLLRLRQVISNWKDRMAPHARRIIQVETWTEGSGELKVGDLIRVLENLDSMAKRAISRDGVIRFLGV